VTNEREDDSNEDTVTETQINEVRRKTRDPKNFAAQMNKETWGSLSKDNQKTWDEISKEDKAKILQYSMDREAKRTTLIKANMHLTDTISENEDVANEGDDEVSVEDGNPQISVNNAIQRARNDAHIGDPR
jgi:TRAP-type C4-dicarboxylate transport system substrate-binding protein